MMRGVIPDAFFVPDGPRFVATAHARGPWSPGHQHGGPPSALLARALEQTLAGTGMMIARLTIDLLSPVPLGTVEVTAAVIRAGRKVQRLEGAVSAEGRPVLRATALAVRTTDLPVPTVARSRAIPPPEASTPFVFPFFHEDIGYATAVEGRVARGVWGKGATAVWVRPRVRLLPDEPLTPLQRVMIAADSGNGVAVVLDPARWTFVNADLTVALHRLPAGEWMGLDADTTPEPAGVGLTIARLLDEGGPIGIAVQGLVIEPR